MAQLLDDSWKTWVNENMGLGVPKQTIYDTLKNHKFDLGNITSVMGWSPSEEATNVVDVKVTPNKQKLQPTNIIYDKKELKHERRFIYNAERIEVGNDVLDIHRIDNFLSKKECKELVDLTKDNMKKSKISFADKSDSYVDDEVRTSSTCDLYKSHGDVVDRVNDRINAHMGIHMLLGEPMQGQHYDKTQQFKEHTDTFTPNTEEYNKFASDMGQRTWTFMIYLNEPVKGGETKFPKVKTTDGELLSLKPKLGTAITWNNLYVNGDINQHSLHQGCPVKNGEKTIITKWFRERRR
jgi:prolyl 4-hydroxylase